MSTILLQHPSSPSADDLRHVLASAHAIIDQAPPPSLREILSAYRSKGDGDRDMLLAMLNAKTAEDQRMSSVASLQRTLIDLYQHSSEAAPSPRRAYPYTGYPSSSPYPDPSSRKMHSGSRSRSPRRMPHPTPYMVPPPRDLSMPEQPRKRQRSSRSPHSSNTGLYEPMYPTEQFPPSPYSSSERSQSAEYSPRSRTSGMTIGSLLSDTTGPRRDTHGDANLQDRE